VCLVSGLVLILLQGLGERCTVLRRWAGEQAISSVVEMRTILVDVLGVGFGRLDCRCLW
jgi:hypothetical protein